MAFDLRTQQHMKFLARLKGGTEYRCVKDYERPIGTVKLVEGDPCVAYPTADPIGGVDYWWVVGTYHAELVPEYLMAKHLAPVTS